MVPAKYNIFIFLLLFTIQQHCIRWGISLKETLMPQCGINVSFRCGLPPQFSEGHPGKSEFAGYLEDKIAVEIFRAADEQVPAVKQLNLALENRSLRFHHL